MQRQVWKLVRLILHYRNSFVWEISMNLNISQCNSLTTAVTRSFHLKMCQNPVRTTITKILGGHARAGGPFTLPQTLELQSSLFWSCCFADGGVSPHLDSEFSGCAPARRMYSFQRTYYIQHKRHSECVWGLKTGADGPDGSPSFSGDWLIFAGCCEVQLSCSGLDPCRGQPGTSLGARFHGHYNRSVSVHL